MIRLSNIEKLEAKDISKLVTLIQSELKRRAALYERYKRKTNDYDTVSGANGNVVVPLERYIVNTASGYLGGKAPSYEVEDVQDDKSLSIIKNILNKIIGKETQKEEMEAIIDYITKYNDDGIEHYTLVKDIIMLGACYEIIYENEDNEKVYARLDPLQTVAIWDYSVPKNLVGLVQFYVETDLQGQTKNVVRLTDKDGIRLFKGQGEAYEEIKQEQSDEENIIGWGDVPAIVVELPDNTSLFEPVIDIIDAYQQLIKNTKDTFNYNNNAKLKVTGYRPEEELLVQNEKGELIENPKRVAQDKALLDAQVFYTPEDGDIAWIEKTIEDGAIQNTLKTYLDLIMMNTGVPQTTDLGFTKADNASAIDRKFFSLEQMTVEAMNLLQQAYLRRWELIFGRINLVKNKNYDFRNITITIPKNLPANENEVVDMYMKLRGLISDETIIERIPLNFDAESEKNKKEEQDEVQLEKEINKASEFNKINQGNEKNSFKKNIQDKKSKSKEEKALQSKQDVV